MTLILGLVLAALVMVFFEVILPGGLLGLLAIGCICVATWLGFLEYGLLGGGSVFIGSILASAVLIFFEFKLLAKTRFGQGFFLKASVAGHSAKPRESDPIVGKAGTTLTRLNPTGKIAIEGRSYEARSQDGYLESGQDVTVVSQDNFELTIRKL